MPTYAWLLIWGVVIAGVVVLVVRERRSGRRGPDDVDRMKHEASREAGMHRDMHGPNGGASLWGG